MIVISGAVTQRKNQSDGWVPAAATVQFVAAATRACLLTIQWEFRALETSIASGQHANTRHRQLNHISVVSLHSL